MPTDVIHEREAKRTLIRLLPRVQEKFKREIKNDPHGWRELNKRLEGRFPQLFKLHLELYGGHYDYFFHAEDLLASIVRAWFARPNDLRELDQKREGDPLWFQLDSPNWSIAWSLEGSNTLDEPWFRTKELSNIRF